MKVNELIEKINSTEDCYSIFDAEDMIEGIYECVECNLNLHRGILYEISTSIYKLEDGYVSVRGVSRLYPNFTYSPSIRCFAESVNFNEE